MRRIAWFYILLPGFELYTKAKGSRVQIPHFASLRYSSAIKPKKEVSYVKSLDKEMLVILKQ
ncbi:MAG: hypothetical protein AB7U98_07460 [Candidatus Nitrosocosmicus sp.]|nr:hypothetical protein [Candidatus Nitrosocosmicus sp.]